MTDQTGMFSADDGLSDEEGGRDKKTVLVAGLTTIELEVRDNNHSARRFYYQLGYADRGYMPGYYRGIETALLMTRTLSRPAPSA